MFTLNKLNQFAKEMKAKHNIDVMDSEMLFSKRSLGITGVAYEPSTNMLVLTEEPIIVEIIYTKT